VNAWAHKGTLFTWWAPAPRSVQVCKSGCINSAATRRGSRHQPGSEAEQEESSSSGQPPSPVLPVEIAPAPLSPLTPLASYFTTSIRAQPSRPIG
jgi:hypothetical protein